MVGGRGWENNNYLDSLDGDENDREDANEKYAEFKESRKQFMKRQEKAMQDPKVREFMQARMNQSLDGRRRGSNDESDEDDFFGTMRNDGMNPFMNEMSSSGGGMGSGGGTKFQNMMNQSQMLQQRQQQQQQQEFSADSFGMFEDLDEEDE